MPPDIKLLDLLFIDMLWSSSQNVFQGIDGNSLVLHCVTFPHFTPLHPSLPINMWRTIPLSPPRSSSISVNCLKRQCCRNTEAWNILHLPLTHWKNLWATKINISSGIKNILIIFNFSSMFDKWSHKRAFLRSKCPLSVLVSANYK